MTTTADLDPDARIARLEEGVRGVVDQVKTIASSVDRLAGEVREGRRPQWQLLLGAGVALLTTVGMAASLILFVVTLLIAPIQTVQAGHETLLDRHQARLDDHKSQLDRQVVQFTEVETQFKALSYYSALTDYEMDRFLRLLWRRVYQEELPPLAERPTVGDGGG